MDRNPGAVRARKRSKALVRACNSLAQAFGCSAPKFSRSDTTIGDNTISRFDIGCCCPACCAAQMVVMNGFEIMSDHLGNFDLVEVSQVEGEVMH